MAEVAKYKVGDLIEWKFAITHQSIFRGKTFRAKIAAVLEEGYGVYAAYGQDIVPFENAILIKRK